MFVLARRAGAVLLSLLVIGVFAGPASAHVTANATDARQGGFTVISFRVPAESDTARSVQLRVEFPPQYPFASVAVQPHPGWTAAVTKGPLPRPITTDDGDSVTEAVTAITWTANPGGGLRPGEYDDFNVSVGPLPRIGTVSFLATQTYSDGSVVRWDQPTPPGGAEPEHPAPTLTLQPADATSTPGGQSGTSTTPTTASSSSSSTDRALAIAALVLGGLGLLAGLAAVVLIRRARSGGTSIATTAARQPGDPVDAAR